MQSGEMGRRGWITGDERREEWDAISKLFKDDRYIRIRSKL